MSDLQKSDTSLQRGLKNRHIQLIALGGAVGTGLFLGIGGAIFSAGPSVLLGYAIAGLLVFLIVRHLGDMVTEEPVAGSFSYFAYKYWGDFPGFLSGWNYWILYVMVGISELTAAAAYMQYWYPGLETWKTTLFFFVAINLINLATVKAFGEMEFWFALIKILAICGMIAIGGYILLLQPDLVPGATVRNLWMPPTVGAHAGDPAYGGFFPKGIGGLILAVPIIMFAFGGLELVGITAAEADDPKKVIPKAINQVIYRILIFYIGTVGILLSLYHWSSLHATDSPFVIIFSKIGFKNVAHVLNFVVLTAALSVYNSAVYCTSRMLYGLALQKNAPAFFARTDKRGVPYAAMLLAGVVTFCVVPLNYFMPSWIDAFHTAMSVVVSALVINWAMISLAHLFFRRKMDKEGIKTSFPAILYPYSNYFCLLAVIVVLSIMATPQMGMRSAVIAVPIWIALVYVGYRISKRNK
ncbi:amino acid permease [uncultured Desulfovibrio sp.]|uniref:Aromatic amino acid transporter n=1 Tax=uncultured Desulfovibrio sp. TaxID=167968 RepID=A0A212L2B7_9BACT|nr:amino acid permease [uncultured Desulfovibrio sp.]SCM71656.1 aromatic amino acid transporter [uncultured Desulfovibrio sp.]